MDKLWAPWRIKYLRATKKSKCIFCEAVKSTNKDYVVFKTKLSICLLNIYPYNNGHVMVSPKKHTGNMEDLKKDEILDLFLALNTAKKLLKKTLDPEGYNIGINLSEVAGAGIPGHLHIHIVPRWIGDTNFMPVLYNTKIISQSLDELHKRLKHAYSKTN